MQCIWNYWHQAERKVHGAVLGLAVLDTKHLTGAGGPQPISDLRDNRKDLREAPQNKDDKDESLMDDDGNIQIVSFNHEKPPQFTASTTAPADNLPIPFHRANLLDAISEEDTDPESYTSELPPYSLVESISTNHSNNGGIDTTERNCFSRYRYETFNDKTFSRADLDFTKFRKAMREVLPVKDTKTSLKRKRFTQSKLFQAGGMLQGHS